MSDPTRAQRASSFGSRAAAYAEHRPDYPREALEWGLSGASGTPRRVLDLAAGTGKLTLGLAELGLDVTAVEPDPEMRAELGRTVPSVTSLAGQAERIPLPDGEVDAVFVGQAFHWFDVPAAMTEIARVLRPGGVLVPMWNYEDDSVPWVAEFGNLGRTGVSRAWTDGSREPATHPAFEPFESRTFHHGQRRTAESLVETIATHSHMIVADPAEAAAALAEIRQFLAANPHTASGEFDLPLRTWTFRALRR
ncbi:class I SAM-dependent methyltransferase [Amycolatopsis mongoliensis]|uniref:Class I SAM-dependent methyltransferase n=1 Tax=Amycolatopsis mongoliensis TaxID=715475 RepID=A0A9Y2NHA6_9PSEU|nr:class I SAM-dependent methyltransferase [Amycolatopsis sp. 4-36]WIY05027.1 class I SAM-dependent methyltransferase [Amycolatopsis sp. 4-36]